MTFFDFIAPGYDRFMRAFGLFQVDRVLACFPAPAGMRIADLGGGTGRYAAALAGRGALATVVEPSRRMAARIPAADGIAVCRADAAATGLPAAGFDAVLLIDLLHHLRRRGDVLPEAVRLLRPKGQLLVVDIPADGGGTARLRRGFEALFCPANAFFTPEELARELAEAGIRERRRERFGSSFLYLGEKP